MFKNILKIFTGTFFSRIFGFFRDIIVARYFGTGIIADAFSIALIFPNIFRQVLGEDMVERAFMPPFKTIHDKGEHAHAWQFISVVFNWFFIALMITTFILYLITPVFFSLKDTVPAIGNYIFSNTQFDYQLTLKLIIILLPFMLFIGLAAFFGGILNFFEKNWIFGFAPIMLSIGVIVGIATLEPIIGGLSIAVGYVLGAFLQMLIQLPFLSSKSFRREHKFKYSFKLNIPNTSFKTIGRESRIITLNALFNKSSEIFGKGIAMNLIQGGVSSLNYAIRLYQLPFAIISLSVARGINPRLNKLKSTNSVDDFKSTFNKGITLYNLIFIPLITALIISSKEIITLVYQRGAFDENSLHLTSNAFMYYAPGLLPMSLVAYYTRVLSLFNKNKFALRISILSAIVNISAAIILIKSTPLKHEAVALASTISFFVNMFFMKYYIHKEIHDYTLSHKSLSLRLVPLIIISIAFIYINHNFIGYYFQSAMHAVTALCIKTTIVMACFGAIYLIIPSFRKQIKMLRQP